MSPLQVGELPSKDIPVRVGVAGTPLVVQKERVLVKGLRGRAWRTGIEFGQLPLGVDLERTFYVFNTGDLGGCWVGVCWDVLEESSDVRF